jgi:cytidylate kinase
LRKTNKVDKLLAKPTVRQRRNSIQIIKIRNEKGDITTETEEIKEKPKNKNTRFKSLYSTKLENLNEMDDFLDRYHLPKLIQDQVN